MKGERKLIRKIILGFAASLLSVAIIYMLNRGGIYIAWAPILAAAIIGTVAGVAEKSGGKIVLGLILGCIGWISGELFSRLLFHSIATWIFVGGFIGLTAGILEKSPLSMIGGILLGAMGGLVGVAAGLSTIAVESWGRFDMQAMSIITAGISISLLLGLKRPRNAGADAVSNNNGSDTQESSKEY